MTGSESSQLQDLETLAAFIDGKLSDAERRRVEERLAEDEELYELYADTMQTLEAEESPTKQSGPRRSSISTGVALAACLLLTVGVLMPRGLGTVGPRGLEPTSDGWPSQALCLIDRSGGSKEELSEVELAIHLGAHHLDLQVALQLGDWQAAVAGLSRLRADTRSHHELVAPWMEQLQLELPEPNAAEDPDAGQRAAWIRTVDDGGDGFEQIFKHLQLIELYRLGRWAESVRLAALSGNSSLVSKKLRRLGRAEKIIRDHQRATREVSEALAQIEQLSSSGAEDLGAVADAFERLLAYLAGHEPLLPGLPAA